MAYVNGGYKPAYYSPVDQFEVGRKNKAKTQSVVQEKKQPKKVASVMAGMSLASSKPLSGPKALDASRDAWANALNTMSGTYTPDPITAIAKVAGMGLAGYGASKAERQKEEGSAAFRAKLAEALSGNPDNAALMGLIADPYADESAQRMAWNMYERNNPTQEELLRRQMLELQMQQSQQGMEQQGITFQQQQEQWRQQQAEIERQNAIRGGQMNTVEGFMGQHEAMGGDLFSPEMQAQLRAQGVQGADPQDTRRYNAMEPYAQAGDYATAFQHYATQPQAGEAPNIQTIYDQNGREMKVEWRNGQWRPIGGAKGGEDEKPMSVPKGSQLYDPKTKTFITPPAGSAPQQAFDDPMKITNQITGSQTQKSASTIAGTLNSMFGSLSDPSAISDLDFVNGVAKILDPTSVVREAEGRMVIESQSIPAQLLGQLNKLANGESALDLNTRIAMYNLAARRGGEMLQQAQQEVDFYRNIAEKNNFDADTYVPRAQQGPRSDFRFLPQMQNQPQMPDGWTPQQPPAAMPAPDAEGWITLPNGVRVRQRGG